jgi:hypothetical protein
MTHADARKTIGFFCTEESPQCIDLDSYPYVEEVGKDTLDATFGVTEIGDAAFSAADPECKYKVGFRLDGADFDLPASCLDGPCYIPYLAARNAYRSMMAGGIAGGLGTAVTFLGPGGKVVKIVKAGALLTGVGFVGWASRGTVQERNASLKSCMGQNRGFYHYTIIY